MTIQSSIALVPGALAPADPSALTGELRRSPAEVAALVLRTQSAFHIVVEVDDRVSYWGEIAEKIFGLAAPKAVGRSVDQLKIGLSLRQLSHHLRRARGRPVPTRLPETIWERPDGSLGLMGMTVNPIEDDEGAPSGAYLLVGSDIRRSRDQQRQRELSRRLQAMSELTAGLSYDVSTPVRFVSTNLRFIRDALGRLTPLLDAYGALSRAARVLDAERVAVALKRVDLLREGEDLDYMMTEVPTAADECLEGLERVDTVTRALAHLSHAGEGAIGPLNFSEVVQTAITVSRHAWRREASLETDLAENLPEVRGDQGALGQVLVSLMVNAGQAVSAKQAEQGEAAVRGKIIVRTQFLESEGVVQFSVQDDGCGIPPDVRARIFHPFFTTNPSGEGAGQGLALAHAIVVDQHGGDLTFDTAMARGSTFHVRLKVA